MKRGYDTVEAGDLGPTTVADAQDLFTVGDQNGPSICRDVVGIVELTDDFGIGPDAMVSPTG